MFPFTDPYSRLRVEREINREGNKIKSRGWERHVDKMKPTLLRRVISEGSVIVSLALLPFLREIEKIRSLASFESQSGCGERCNEWCFFAVHTNSLYVRQGKVDGMIWRVRYREYFAYFAHFSLSSPLSPGFQSSWERLKEKYSFVSLLQTKLKKENDDERSMDGERWTESEEDGDSQSSLLLPSTWKDERSCIDWNEPSLINSLREDFSITGQMERVKEERFLTRIMIIKPKKLHGGKETGPRNGNLRGERKDFEQMMMSEGERKEMMMTREREKSHIGETCSANLQFVSRY